MRRILSSDTFQFFSLMFRPPHFFFRLASNAFPDIGSVGRIGKKKLKSKVTKSFGIGGLGNAGRR